MKKGYKTKVYGPVWRNFWKKPTEEDLFYFSDGCIATVDHVNNKTEWIVTFERRLGAVRHPTGTFAVHPKQCRKVKK